MPQKKRIDLVLPVDLSSKHEYALLALLELATHYDEGEPLQIRQIAAQQNIPDRYLEQLLATLRRGGLVRSQRGAKGGYVLGREPRQITVLDVINCLEGIEVDRSDIQSQTQSVETVVISEIWQEAEEMAKSIFQKYTLQDIREKRDTRQQQDIMYYI
jgi:Rrf2 family protein